MTQTIIPPAKADFNSRSCEGATQGRNHARRARQISTHAPVKERPSGILSLVSEADFNSRSCEGATLKCQYVMYSVQFQLTLL